MSEEQQQPEQQPSALQSFMSGRGPFIILGVLIVISLLAIGVLASMLLRQSDDQASGDGTQPTPFPENGVAVPEESAIIVGVSDSTTVSVTLDVPAGLNLLGRSFDIVPQTVSQNGVWTPGIEEEGNAGWVYGSVINYIMGLRGTDANREMLESLVPGDTVVLTTASGNRLNFEFASRTLVPVNDQTIFGQSEPQMTLVLLEAGGDERLVVRTRYVVAESLNGSGSSGVVEVGEPAQLADLQLTVTGVTYVPDRPETPPGFAFFLVNFQIQNGSAQPIELSRLQLTLVDELGNQYALNPVATQLGENPGLSGGTLGSGQFVAVTAGYQVPAGLVSSSLRWIVTRTDTGAQVQVVIPFNANAATTTAQVALQSVSIAEDLSSMTLAGQITNPSEQPLVIVESDVTLRTEDGASYLLLSTNPPFPWTVPPGQTLQYSVTFQRPFTANAAVFTVLNQPFQITNLQ